MYPKVTYRQALFPSIWHGLPTPTSCTIAFHFNESRPSTPSHDLISLLRSLRRGVLWQALMSKRPPRCPSVLIPQIRSSTHAEFWSRTRPHPAAHFTNHSGWSLHMRANILPSKSFQRRLPKICERAPPGFEASSKLDYSIALGEIAIDQPSSTTVN